jgi:hypothetical protein
LLVQLQLFIFEVIQLILFILLQPFILLTLIIIFPIQSKPFFLIQPLLPFSLQLLVLILLSKQVLQLSFSRLLLLKLFLELLLPIVT